MRLKRGLALVMSVLLAVPGIVMPIRSVSESTDEDRRE